MRFFSAFFLLASVVVAGFAASVANVKSDIGQTLTFVKALDDAINKIPSNGATLSQGIAIQSNLIKAENALDKGTTDVKATPPFDADASKDILAAFKTIVPTNVHLLKNVVAKKASIVRIPFPGIAGLVRDALKKLQASSDAFQNVLIESYHSEDDKNEARGIKGELDAAFGDAVRAYS
ncbi:hypothetical protein LshimejAT787_0600690 [Lyophyllum shimeji]|uniref:Hydrophobic surface binding protein n=1 Tax=Lyophyllum shimeji TaxID=47721 RepID=A0A9P3UN27_LYOSH|nr:hypothetical protein LshimejAT787_0600690 [Lyophyllum shimeji]